MKLVAARSRDDVEKAEATANRSRPDCRSTLQRIVKSCIEAIQDHKTRAATGEPEAIHGMRIELTRLRAAWLFFSPILEDDTAWPDIHRRIRWLNSVLGKARNRDVIIEFADRNRYRRWTRRSRGNMLRSQDEAHRRLANALGSSRYDSFIRVLTRWGLSDTSSHTRQAPQIDDIELYCDERLREWRHDISSQGRHIGALDRKAMHRLRIECKYYRYVVGSLVNLGIPISRENFSFSEPARRIHQTLGDLRDLRQLRKAVGSRPPHYRKRKRKIIRRAEDSFRHPWVTPT